MSIEEKTKQVADCLQAGELERFEDALAWQRKFRNAVDELVKEKLTPSFNREFNSRYASSTTTEGMREICTWANHVIHDQAMLCVKSPVRGLPSIFVTQKGRASDKGRIYLVSYPTTDEPTRQFFRIDLPLNVELCSMPRRPSNLSRNR